MRYVAYYRVSTQRQGRSGLGLEAQQDAVRVFTAGHEVVESFVEVESGKRDENRPKLQEAIALAKAYGAKLIVAKLDRLARNVHFITKLQEAKVPFIACDMPDANELTVHIMAALAQHESKMISERTKAALAQARKRGVKLGNPDNLTQEAAMEALPKAREARSRKAAERREAVKPIVDRLKAEGHETAYSIAKELNELGIPTPSGRGKWYPHTVPV